jgi:hypothetical protein
VSEPIGSFWSRGPFAVLLALTGLLSAVALAACGEGGTVGGGTLAGQATRTSASVSVSRSTPTQTRGEATITETQSLTTTVATTSESRPAVTVNQATTVVTVATSSSTVAAQTSEETPAWVWVVATIFCGVVVGLIVLLIRRHPHQVSAEERRRLLAATVATWTGAGWAIESQTGESAVVVRDGERTLIAVDGAGQVTSGLLGAPADE